MKLYHFLVLSLFTFVSCDSIEIPFVEKNVYVLSRPEYDTISFSFGSEEKRTSIEVFCSINIKYTISDEDDCVYYLYDAAIVRPKDLTEDQTRLFNHISEKGFEVEFYDKEGNEIFSHRDSTNGKLRNVSNEEFRSKIKRMESFKIKAYVWAAPGKYGYY